MSASNLASPSRSNAHAGWSNPTEYDEGEDPFDPFSNYQYGNGYENGLDSVTQRLQAVSRLSDYLSSHKFLYSPPPALIRIDLNATFPAGRQHLR